MEKYKNVLISAISMVFGAFFQYLYTLADEKQLFLYFITLVILIFAVVILFVIQFYKRKKQLRYSVLIFILDENDRLLTVYNSYHNRIMIPCGIVPKKLTPNEAAEEFIKEQTGLTMNDITILNWITMKDNLITYNAQIEFITIHENNVKKHYAFIYYARINLPNDELVNIDNNVCFHTVEELEEMNRETGLFSDILSRYKILIDNK